MTFTLTFSVPYGRIDIIIRRATEVVITGRS